MKNEISIDKENVESLVENINYLLHKQQNEGLTKQEYKKLKNFYMEVMPIFKFKVEYFV